MQSRVDTAESTTPLFGDLEDEPHVEAGPTSPFARSREQLRVRLYFELALLDLAIIACAFFGASELRFGAIVQQQAMPMLGFVLPIFTVVAIHNRSYSQEVLARPGIGARRAAAAMAYVCALVLIAFFCLKISASFSRIAFVTGVATSVCALVVGRLVAGRQIARSHRGRFSNKLLLVDEVEVAPDHDQFVLFVDRLIPGSEMDLCAGFERIGRLLQHCEVVCVACPPERRPLWAQFLKGTGIDVEFVMPELTEFNAASLRSTEAGQTVITSRGPLGLRERIYKRAVDLLIAGCALLMFAIPMIAIAVAIKIDSPGPVLFRQPRMGKNNRVFNVLKFRSMRFHCGDPHGQLSTARNDRRVTRVGNLLRRTSLDELPQLFNVLRGEMSIVGPRPHALASTADDLLFWEIDGRYFHRHAAKPGLTGLAQVRGFRGATLNRLDLTNRLTSDLEYLSGWTLSGDLKIIINTFRVLMHSNAF